MIPKRVRELAEDPSAYTSPGGAAKRIDGGGWSLVIADTDRSTILSRLRLRDGELEQAVIDVRRYAGAAGRSFVTWWLSDSTAPADAEHRLLEIGFERSEPPLFEPTYEALALVEPPPDAPAAVDVSRVAGIDDLAAVGRLSNEVFGIGEDERDPLEAAAKDWAREQMYEVATFSACLDGRLVGYARSVYAEHGAFMAGGATLPEARGRGVYRALVRARWEDAVARGVPALTTQAGAMSAPALRHLGFEHVADIRVLVDRAIIAP